MKHAKRAVLATALSVFVALPTLAQVTGSGTTNTITKWTGTSTIGNSTMTETSGAVVLPGTGSIGVGGTSPSGYQFFATTSTAGVSSAFRLHSAYYDASTSFIGNFGTFGTIISHNREPQLGGFVDAAASPNQHLAGFIVVGDTRRMRLFQVTNMVGGNESVKLNVDYSGNLTASGNLHAAGNITAGGQLSAKFQDIAEWVPATADLAPGTVVVLNQARNNEVMASSAAYDTAVAGVVSAQPGLTLGVEEKGMEQIATTGRVKVRVDSRSAPIRIGDLLVTSDTPGTAMRSEPMNIHGRKFHQPGTIIGKALEPHNGGEGEILVLLSLQ